MSSKVRYGSSPAVARCTVKMAARRNRVARGFGGSVYTPRWMPTRGSIERETRGFFSVSRTFEQILPAKCFKSLRRDCLSCLHSGRTCMHCRSLRAEICPMFRNHGPMLTRVMEEICHVGIYNRRYPPLGRTTSGRERGKKGEGDLPKSASRPKVSQSPGNPNFSSYLFLTHHLPPSSQSVRLSTENSQHGSPTDWCVHASKAS